MIFSRLLTQSVFWRFGYYLSLLLLNVSIARYFQASLSGWFNYLLSIYSFVVLVSSLSLDSAISYSISNKKTPIKFLNRLIFFWCLFAGLVSTILILIFQHNHFQNLAFNGFIIYSFLFITGYLFITLNQVIFYATHDFRSPALLAITFNLLLLATLIFTSIIGIQISIDVFFIIYSGSFFLQGLILWLLSISKERFTKQDDISNKKVLLKNIFNYALLVFIGNLIFFLVYRVDYWFVNRYSGELLLGNYVQVSKLVQLFMLLPASVASVIFISAAKADLVWKLCLLLRFVFFAYMVLLLILAVTGQWLFVTVFGESFSKMYIPFLLLIPGILSLAVTSLLGAYFASQGQVKVNVIGAVIALLIITTGDMLLVPAWNIKGAAIVSSVGYLCNMGYQLFIFNKLHAIKYVDYFFLNKKDVTFIRAKLKDVFISNVVQ